MTLRGGSSERYELRVIFRVDASLAIGHGHSMRCLALAIALRERGAAVFFVCREHDGNLCKLIEEQSFSVSRLPVPEAGTQGEDVLAHLFWLGTTWQEDAEQTRVVIAALGIKPDWLVVDHYAIDHRWEDALRGSVGRIMVVDDVADRQHDCDVLLDQNLYTDMHARYAGKVPAHCRLLLGPGYALVHEKFRQLREQVTPHIGPIKRVLVFFGGVDANNCTARAIEALANMGGYGLHVDVVIGAQHPCREQIESECVQYGFSCHVQTSRMAELMAAADLAIGAGGAASWERCCLGLPALIVALADNQIDIAKTLDLFGANIYLGSLEIASAPLMRRAIIDLMNDQSRLAALSEKSYALVDGLGTARLCQALGY